LLTKDLVFIDKKKLSILKKRHRKIRKNVKGTDKVFIKQTLEPLTP
jgi:hypothetical protein